MKCTYIIGAALASPVAVSQEMTFDIDSFLYLIMAINSQTRETVQGKKNPIYRILCVNCNFCYRRADLLTNLQLPSYQLKPVALAMMCILSSIDNNKGDVILLQ